MASASVPPRPSPRPPPLLLARAQRSRPVRALALFLGNGDLAGFPAAQSPEENSPTVRGCGESAFSGAAGGADKGAHSDGRGHCEDRGSSWPRRPGTLRAPGRSSRPLRWIPRNRLPQPVPPQRPDDPLQAAPLPAAPCLPRAVPPPALPGLSPPLLHGRSDSSSISPPAAARAVARPGCSVCPSALAVLSPHRGTVRGGGGSRRAFWSPRRLRPSPRAPALPAHC